MAFTIGELVAKITANTRRFDRAFKNVDATIAKTAKNAGRLDVSFRNVAKGVGIAVVAITAGTVALGKFAQAGTKINTVQTAFARRVGDSSAAIKGLTSATRGLISQQELMLSFNQAVTLGAAKTTEEFAQMAEAALVLGRALGVDAAFALDSMTLGIGRQSRQILDNLGLVVRVEEATRKYAEALGVTTAALDDTQRREAFRTEALFQINQATKDLGGLTLDAGDAFTQLTVAIKDSVDQMALAVAQSGRLKTAFEGIRDVIREIGGGPSGPAQAFIDSIGNVEDIDILIQRWGELVQIQDRVAAARERFSQALLDVDRRDPAKAITQEGIAFAALDSALQDANESLVEFGLTAKDLPFALAGIVAQLIKLQTGVEGVTEAARVLPTVRFRGIGGPSALDIRPAIDRSQAGRDRIFEKFTKILDRITLQNVRTPGAAAGFLGTLGEQLKSTLDPTRIVSGIVANLVSGGISSLISGATGLIGGLFGGDTGRILEANTEALRRNTDALISAVTGAPGGLIGASIQGLERAIAALGQGFGRGGLNKPTFDDLTLGLQELEAALRAAGFSIDDLRDVLAKGGITLLPESIKSLEQALTALRDQVSLASRIGLARRRIGLLDITDPTDQFAEFQKALATSLGGAFNGLGATIARLSVDTIDDFVAGILAQIEAGTFDFARLGDISIDDFLAALGELESLGDAAANAANEINGLAGALRNAPAGFKIAGPRFNATTGTPTTGLGQDIPPPLIFRDAIINVFADDPIEMLREVEFAAKKQAQRGGTSQLTLSTRPRTAVTSQTP